MLLTVCTATYNACSAFGAASIERCIRSVASLPVEHEHVVCDGASVDGTRDVLLRLAREIPSLRVLSEKDRGIYDALNKGLSSARGDYFYVLGADDFVCDSQTLVDALAHVKTEESDVFVSPVLLGNGGRAPAPWREIFDMDLGMAYSHQGAFIRTALARALGGYDDTYRLAADYKLHLSAHWRGAKVVLSRRPFACYGVSGASSVATAQTLREECARARTEVFCLSPAQVARHFRFGNLPLDVAWTFLRQRDRYNRRIGISCLLHGLWHKHKDAVFSMRCLCGLPVFRRQRRVA